MIGRAIQHPLSINTAANLRLTHMCAEFDSKHIFIMSDSELNVGDFDPETYQHVLPEGAHDFDDYDSEYEREYPELGFTDAQVEEEVKKLSAEDRSGTKNIRSFWTSTIVNMDE